jgi:hypothetical protein
MIEPRVFAPARLQLLVIAVLALAIFAYAAAPKLNVTPTTAQPAPAVVQHSTIAVSAKNVEDSCSTGGAYVTGDMVGDANPAAVYAALCSTH